jgi:hypothetical protein
VRTPTALIYLTSLLMTVGCSILRIEQSPNSTAHITLMPATQTSILSATDGQWSDRAQRAGDDVAEDGDVSAEQTADSIPTLTIPLTGATSAEASAAAEKFLEKQDEEDKE